MFKRVLKIVSLAAACLAVAALAYASEAHGEAHPLPWGNFAWRIVNFVIFATFLWKFAGKKAIDFFKGRRYQIESELADLDGRKADALRRLQEVEQSIRNIEQERAQVLAEFKAQGEALRDSIVEKAHKSAAQIKEQAKLTASQEAKVALDQIRGDVAEMVVTAAQDLLRKKLTKEDHDKLVDEYLTKVVLH